MATPQEKPWWSEGLRIGIGKIEEIGELLRREIETTELIDALFDACGEDWNVMEALIMLLPSKDAAEETLKKADWLTENEREQVIDTIYQDKQAVSRFIDAMWPVVRTTTCGAKQWRRTDFKSSFNLQDRIPVLEVSVEDREEEHLFTSEESAMGFTENAAWLLGGVADTYEACREIGVPLYKFYIARERAALVRGLGRLMRIAKALELDFEDILEKAHKEQVPEEPSE